MDREEMERKGEEREEVQGQEEKKRIKSTQAMQYKGERGEEQQKGTPTVSL